ncbi:MAG: FG-GAP repeat domain-containing protein, partial [Saprospiraceae bacterium]
YGKVGNALPEMYTSGNIARLADFDQDGFQDIFAGGATLPGRYPYPERSYLLRFDMESRKFVDVTADIAPGLMAPGSVKDALWTDLNDDGYPDLVVVGEWMPVSIFINEKGTFRDASAEYGTDKLKGWWYSIAQADLDNDGDKDLVVGNLGLNGKFHATQEKPFNVFASDFDKNGTCDVVLSKEYKGRLVPTRGRQCSSQQMPFIKDKFPTYKDFANAGVEDILGKENLKESLHLQVTTFESIVLLNEGGRFVVQDLPNEAQIAPINGIICSDLDDDGNQDIILAGNNFDAEVETPRYDAGSGLVLKGNGDGTFRPVLPRQSGFYAPGNVKYICLLNHAPGDNKLILVANNNAPLQVFRVKGKELLTMK